MTYLSDYPALQALYAAKQKLVRSMLLKTLTALRARAKLRGSPELLEQLRDSPLRSLVQTDELDGADYSHVAIDENQRDH